MAGRRSAGLRLTVLLPSVLRPRKWLRVAKRWLRKPEYGAQHSRKNPGTAVNAYDPSTGRQRRGAPVWKEVLVLPVSERQFL